MALSRFGTSRSAAPHYVVNISEYPISLSGTCLEREGALLCKGA